jgi:hypothetical protein
MAGLPNLRAATEGRPYNILFGQLVRVGGKQTRFSISSLDKKGSGLQSWNLGICGFRFYKSSHRFAKA